jgi:hypothetical protein
MKERNQLVYANGLKTKLFYPADTDPRVVALIERNLNTRHRVRLFYGDTARADFEQVHGGLPDPGKDWGEENDVTGTIGCSMGQIKIALLIHNARSMGGGGIMEDSIVRMMVDGREVYRHSNYHSAYDSAYVRISELAPEYSHAVYTEESGEVARFHSERAAANYLAFMRGERMSK